jgi:hypothetical protein
LVNVPPEFIIRKDEIFRTLVPVSRPPPIVSVPLIDNDLHKAGVDVK